MLENYDDLTVDETLDAVADWDDERKAQFLSFEADHKNRTGVVTELESELGVSATDITETVEVTITTGNYAAGIWFDDATESQTVELTSRVERALEQGTLERVDS